MEKESGVLPKRSPASTPHSLVTFLDLLLILMGLFVPVRETEIPERKGSPAGTLGLLQ